LNIISLKHHDFGLTYLMEQVKSFELVLNARRKLRRGTCTKNLSWYTQMYVQVGTNLKNRFLVLK